MCIRDSYNVGHRYSQTLLRRKKKQLNYGQKTVFSYRNLAILFPTGRNGFLAVIRQFFLLNSIREQKMPNVIVYLLKKSGLQISSAVIEKRDFPQTKNRSGYLVIGL